MCIVKRELGAWVVCGLVHVDTLPLHPLQTCSWVSWGLHNGQVLLGVGLRLWLEGCLEGADGGGFSGSVRCWELVQ